jgi:hypothetical protein
MSVVAPELLSVELEHPASAMAAATPVAAIAFDIVFIVFLSWAQRFSGSMQSGPAPMPTRWRQDSDYRWTRVKQSKAAACICQTDAS